MGNLSKHKGIQGGRGIIATGSTIGGRGISIPTGGSSFLLDQFGGAAAAYSVRLLSSTYTGGLVRVRRSSDNQEKDFLPDSNNELSLSSQAVIGSQTLGNFVGANDGFVVTWYDQSGGSANITQSTAANQRQIVSSGTLITDNSKAAAQNTATSTQYNSTGRLYDLNAPNLWVFGTQNLTAADNTFAYILGSNVADRGLLIISNSTSENIRLATVRSGGSNVDNVGAFGALVGQKVLTVNANRTTKTAWLNSTIQGSPTADNDSDFTTFTNNTIWGQQDSPSRHVYGKVQELIIYQTDQSANRTAIEQNINTYYDVYWDGTVSDPDAQAFLDEVVAQGGSLTNKVADEYNAFVVREKAAARYSKILRLYPFLGGVIDSARIDAINLGQATNNNFVDADADATIGLQGDGSTKSLLESENTDVIFSSINNGLGVIFDGTQTNPNSFKGIVGFYESSTTKIESLQFDTSNRLRFYSPALADQVITVATSFESIIGWRESSTSQKIAIDTTVTTNTVAASISTLSSVKIGYFGRSFNGTVFNQNSLKYLLAFLQEGMDESEILAFRSSYKTFLTNIGAI